jgi:hypothetical protein
MIKNQLQYITFTSVACLKLLCFIIIYYFSERFRLKFLKHTKLSIIIVILIKILITYDPNSIHLLTKIFIIFIKKHKKHIKKYF